MHTALKHHIKRLPYGPKTHGAEKKEKTRKNSLQLLAKKKKSKRARRDFREGAPPPLLGVEGHEHFRDLRESATSPFRTRGLLVAPALSKFFRKTKEARVAFEASRSIQPELRAH